MALPVPTWHAKDAVTAACNYQELLESAAKKSPHQARRRADGGPALEPRPEAPCPADDELDPETKAMCDRLVDMAFRKLLRQAGATTVVKER